MTGLDLGATAVASLARYLLGEPNRALSTSRELRFGRRGSMAVIPERGVWSDYEAGVGGGVLDLVVHVGEARTRAEAARMLDRGDKFSLELSRARKTVTFAASKRRDQARRQVVAAALWWASGPLRGTTAETYLRRARGVLGPLDVAELRFHHRAPLTPYRPDGRACRALVARVAGTDGQLIGVQLTFLAADGSAKADLPSPRKMVGTMTGGAVTLRPGRAGAVVGEGLESTLSAADALNAAHGALSMRLAAVAALSAHGLATLPLRPTWRELVIAPDRDPSATGERAARQLAERAWAAGLDVRFMPPPEGCGDWNDAARTGGTWP